MSQICLKYYSEKGKIGKTRLAQHQWLVSLRD